MNAAAETTNNAPSWEQLLIDAVEKPGKIEQAYKLFHNYSLGNALLALFQFEAREIQPGPINTYQGWKALGRQVKKGEKALSLVMPLTYKSKNRDSNAENGDQQEGKTFTRFAYKPHWFALTQTEGPDVAAIELPSWDGETALANLGVTRVEFESMNGNCQGYAMPGKKLSINPVCSQPEATMFHELAHIVLGHTEEGTLSDDERTPRSLKEAEAESVALLCCASLNLPGQEYSRGYIQHWLKGAPIPEKSAQKIFATAAAILKAGQDKPAEQAAA